MPKAKIPKYDVKLPFAALKTWRLAPPLDYPHGIHIVQSNDDYLAIIKVEIQDARSALSHAEGLLSA